ncbi:unnamed protein product, partial [Amoebophrya sp. A120]|eukprot:GSA120T00005405001.1
MDKLARGKSAGSRRSKDFLLRFLEKRKGFLQDVAAEQERLRKMAENGLIDGSDGRLTADGQRILIEDAGHRCTDDPTEFQRWHQSRLDGAVIGKDLEFKDKSDEEIKKIQEKRQKEYEKKVKNGEIQPPKPKTPEEIEDAKYMVYRCEDGKHPVTGEPVAPVPQSLVFDETGQEITFARKNDPRQTENNARLKEIEEERKKLGEPKGNVKKIQDWEKEVENDEKETDVTKKKMGAKSHERRQQIARMKDGEADMEKDKDGKRKDGKLDVLQFGDKGKADKREMKDFGVVNLTPEEREDLRKREALDREEQELKREHEYGTDTGQIALEVVRQHKEQRKKDAKDGNGG